MNTARFSAVLLAVISCHGPLVATDLLDAPGRGYREQRDGWKQHDLLWRPIPVPLVRVEPLVSKPATDPGMLLESLGPAVPRADEPQSLSKDFSLSLGGASPGLKLDK